MLYYNIVCCMLRGRKRWAYKVLEIDWNPWNADRMMIKFAHTDFDHSENVLLPHLRRDGTVSKRGDDQSDQSMMSPAFFVFKNAGLLAH